MTDDDDDTEPVEEDEQHMRASAASTVKAMLELDDNYCVNYDGKAVRDVRLQGPTVYKWKWAKPKFRELKQGELQIV